MSEAIPGNADVPVGMHAEKPTETPPLTDVPRKGWYSRGYLPHRDEAHLLQSITFRLADSLPQKKLKELEAHLETLSEERRETEKRQRIEAWLDAGMGCCALRHSHVARHVQDSLLHFHGQRYDLHAWCIMPNHVHTLVKPITPISTIVQGWKSFTARWVLAQNAKLKLGIPGEHFWMRDYWDRFIRDERHYAKVIEYIHENPVKAGLCAHAGAWEWSSFNWMKADGDVGVPRWMKADNNAGVSKE